MTLSVREPFPEDIRPTPPRDLESRALESWLKHNIEGYAGPLEVRRFAGGQSNPTYPLLAPGRRYGRLRRQPAGDLLRSAHAVDREFRVIRAPSAAGYPVPRALALCEVAPATMREAFDQSRRFSARDLLIHAGERLNFEAHWCGATAFGHVLMRDLGVRRGDYLSQAPQPLPDIDVGPDDDATIFYTSGTPGRTKRAVGTHRNLATNLVNTGFRAARAAVWRGARPPRPPPAPRLQLLPPPFFHVTAFHPGVFEGAVVGVPHPVLGEVMGAILRVVPARPLTTDALLEHLAPRLAAHKCPVAIQFRERPLPRNAAGKVLKRELKAGLIHDRRISA